MDELKAKLKPSNDASQPADLISLGHSVSAGTASHDTTPTSKPSQLDRKSNIVLSGIKECPKGTGKLDHFKQDLNNVVYVLHSVDPDFVKQNIQDCFRLGKFKENATCPRSILIKFYRPLDAMSLLSTKSSLPNGIVLKPDMTQEERNTDSLLLQEHWHLM